MLPSSLKRAFAWVAMVCVAVCLTAQTYVGTLTMGSYTRHNVEARLAKKGSGAELLLKKVKFARMMPVTVDVAIADIKATASGSEVRLEADGVVPTAENKSYERHMVHRLSGTASKTLVVDCLLGDKPMHFEGAIKTTKNK